MQGAGVGLDGRIALGRAEFLLDPLPRHLLPRVPLRILEQVVGGRDHGEHGNDGAEKLQGDREQERQDRHRIAIICPFLSRQTAEYWLMAI